MNLLIKSLNTKVIVNCDKIIGLDIINSDFIKKYIPEVEIKETDVNDIDFNLFISNIDKVKFSLQNNQAVLNGNYKSEYNINDLITVIDYCLEYRRQLENIYSVSGSAISKDGKGILILGSTSGMGKTTLALNMCYSQGFKLIGDEKILLTHDSIVGGIKSLQFNKEWLNESIPKDIDKKLIIERENVKMSLVIQPSISKNSSGLEIEKWDQVKTGFHLYEELTRKIRGISRRISDYTYPLISVDNETISLLRSEFSNDLSKSIDAYSIKGNLEDVTQKVNSLL